ncbi:hypothetical protein ACHHYP_00779 [Achlya hypogyna]|uniref:PGAP2IP C-terminal nuclease-like domain-containing protein n=1 Tax=Achlya hypogyna TaxID=1202772 RepID=A0A1V9ZUI9_ACHHY|nr:hypothetical protein ACHHYP_00779 [Achlya hypogyna]
MALGNSLTMERRDGLLLAAHTFVGVLFWSFAEALPRETYWFALEAMDIPSEVVYLAVLLVPSGLLLSFQVRRLAAQYCGVGLLVADLCMLHRFVSSSAEAHLLAGCAGMAALLLVLCALWSFTHHVRPLSADQSVTLPRLSVAGLVLGNLIVLWLRWAGRSLNPIVPEDPVPRVVCGIFHVPILAASFVLVYYHRAFMLASGPVAACQWGCGRRGVALVGLPCLIFFTQWLYTAPTGVPRWIGVAPTWGWLVLAAFTVGCLGAHTGGAYFATGLFALGGVCFHVSASSGVALFGAALLGLALPSIWLLLVPGSFAALTATTADVDVVTKPTALGPAMDLSSEPEVPGVTPEPSRAKTCSVASWVGASAFFLALGYILLVALAITLTTYDYLPAELAGLRGQRFVIFYAVVAGVTVATLLLFDGPASWSMAMSSMDAVRVRVTLAIVVIVVIPAAVVHLMTSALPGSRVPSNTLGNTTSDLRLLSFNVYQGFNRAGGNNFGHVLAMIKDYDPHIVAFQESDTMQMGSGGIDLTEFVASQRGMYSFADPKTQDDSFGCALLSSYPIEAATGIVLPSHGENACLQHVVLDVHGVALTVINIHLGNDGTADRDAQLLVVEHYVQSSTGPVVLTGDFNTPKWSHAYNSVMARVHMTDAGTEGNCVRPSVNPASGRPIEYILYRNLSCIEFEYPQTYSQLKTADSFPRIAFVNLTTA